METQITENRETFFARLTPFMTPAELRYVETAYMLGKFGHRAQVRKEKDTDGNPIRYWEHCRAVALILIDEANVRDWRLICAALLHDCIEDTKDITPEIIEHIFGERVCQIVKILSKVPKEGYLERLKKYGDQEIILIKAADRLSNMRTLKGCSPEFIAKQVEETNTKLIPLFRFMTMKETETSYRVNWIIRLLYVELEKF